MKFDVYVKYPKKKECEKIIKDKLINNSIKRSLINGIQLPLSPITTLHNMLYENIKTIR